MQLTRSQNIAHIPAIDHLRLLAATLVFCFHLFHLYVGQWKPFPQSAGLGLIVEGHTGVALFFVLSGFIFMTIALQNKAIDYGSFIRNRFLRIFPLFLLFFYIAISVGREEFRAADVLYIFFSNIGQAPTSNSFITGAAWTISVEFTFYLVFPFLARFAMQQGVRYLLQLLVLLLIVKLAAYGVSQRPTHMFYSTLLGRFDQFLWGMVAAMLWHQHRAWIERYGRWLLLGGCLLVWLATAMLARHASYFSPDPRQALWVVWSTIEAVVWAWLILGYLGARLRWPPLMERALTLGGGWSYSFYLWHGLLLYVAHSHLGVWLPTDNVYLNVLANFAYLFPVAMALAALSYATIEQPFLKLRQPYLKT